MANGRKKGMDLMAVVSGVLGGTAANLSIDQLSLNVDFFRDNAMITPLAIAAVGVTGSMFTQNATKAFFDGLTYVAGADLLTPYVSDLLPGGGGVQGVSYSQMNPHAAVGNTII
jgi:hypothetical protein